MIIYLKIFSWWRCEGGGAGGYLEQGSAHIMQQTVAITQHTPTRANKSFLLTTGAVTSWLCVFLLLVHPPFHHALLSSSIGHLVMNSGPCGMRVEKTLPQSHHSPESPVVLTQSNVHILYLCFEGNNVIRTALSSASLTDGFKFSI